MRRAPRFAATAFAAFALAGSAFAAQQLVGRARPPADAVVTISSTAPLFAADGLVGGERLERCTTLRNEGPQPADVTLFGTAAINDLSPWLDLDLVRGTLPPGTAPGDCTGFVPDAADYGAGVAGVVFRGTLATLPGGESGIADPSRWSVGEEHSYLLRVTYTGQNPQQGLRTVQDFNWGVTPFDDRPPESFTDPSAAPTGTGAGTGGAGTGGSTSGAGPRQCAAVSFGPGRPYIGARAVIRAKAVNPKRTTAKRKARTAALAALGARPRDVLADGELLDALPVAELKRRAALLGATRHTTATASARRMPVMVVRITAGKSGSLNLRVALRKNGRLTSPRRWRWVRMRLNATATKSTVRWPFVSVAQMRQLHTGYNQIDLTLNRGTRGARVKGYPRLVRRSFAFVVKAGSGSSDCTLG